MHHFTKLILCIAVSLSSLHAAAMFSCTEYHEGVTRVNCIIEKDGVVDHHASCKHPCVVFFDIVGDGGDNLNQLVLKYLVEKKIIDRTDHIHLELFGIRSGSSIYPSWHPISEQERNEFWQHATGLSALLKESRDLDRVHVGTSSFARYLLKVMYTSTK